MALAKVLALALVVAINWQEIYGHGMMMDPVSRSSAWRKGFGTPKNWNDNELFCGGFGIQHQKNGGKCGVCGDDYSLPQPRPNENGGTYGTGVIVQKYNPGQVANMHVVLSANHMGHFKFNMCVLKHSKDLETDECFEKHPLKLADGSGYKYPVRQGIRDFNIAVRLPSGVKCEHCVIRWDYLAGNIWGMCPDGRGRVGCGPQETFRSCADVTIL